MTKLFTSRKTGQNTLWRLCEDGSLRIWDCLGM
jgi:hypothetical protein